MMGRLMMWIVMIVGGIVGGWYLDGKCFASLAHSWAFHGATFVAGVLLLVAVLRISARSGRTLARLGRRGDIPRMETNVLVTDGLYRLMRHPMHLGLLFFPLSIALIVGSPSFIVCIAPAEMAMMVVLIKLFEEREAIEKFGEDYRKYMQTTPMFCVRIACLKELMGWHT